MCRPHAHRARGLGEGVGVERQRIESGPARESFAAGDALERRSERDLVCAATMAFPRRRRPGELRDQVFQIGHDRIGAARRGVELEQRELGIVRSRYFAVAEDARELVAARETGPRKQPLHRVFGAGVQVQLFAIVHTAGWNRRIGREDRLERSQMRLLPGEGHRDRRLDLEVSERRQPVAERAGHGRAGGSHLGGGRHRGAS